MKPNIFMSYSRREVGFVDDLTHKLEQQGYQVWLDYRSLVPGTPWAGQIDKGLDEAEVVLLVVSKASMASQYVELEWRRVLKENKRVILLIFEAVDLPAELEKFEWVDFRGNYEAGLKELARQLETQVQEEHPAPETGFKIPVTVWAAFALSMIVSLYALGSFWTIFILWLLLPLPYRILKRDYNFTMVQAAIAFLPFALYMTSYIVTKDETITTFENLTFASAFFAFPLIFVLRLPAMQRWGKPEATLPRFANLYKPDNLKPSPVPFYVDYAVQDRLIADELTRVLKEYGHPQAESIQAAKAVFVLLSAYKNDTEANPESQTVFPVMVQTCKPADKLSKVQWIDFRAGSRNLEAIAQLLPEPGRLLQALGIRPMGNNLLLPPVIQALVYFIAFLAIFTFGSWLPYFYQYLPDIMENEGLAGILIGFAISLVIFGVLSWFMARGIVNRRGWFSSLPAIATGMFLLGLIILYQNEFDAVFLDYIGIEEDVRGFSSYFPPVIYLVGNLIMIVFIAILYKSVRLWFPARAPKKA